jgi:hypothetical protein
VEEPDDSKLVMFQMGTANEQVVLNDLHQTMSEDEVILCEEEIPIQWVTSNGTKVTGRPDMVICRLDPAGTHPVPSSHPLPLGSKATPIWGVEIKSIASVWTSREVLGNQQPKLEHMIQAGHYAWKLGIPFRLLYKQYGIQEIPFWKGSGKGPEAKPGWGQSLFPKQGQPGSEHIDYDKGRIQPFEISYELEWIKGVMHYRREGSSSKWERTLIQQVDIERYYEFVSRMGQDKKLGDRPMTVDAAGKEKSFSLCGYCPLNDVCKKTEKLGYDKWLETVRQFQGSLAVRKYQGGMK